MPTEGALASILGAGQATANRSGHRTIRTTFQMVADIVRPEFIPEDALFRDALGVIASWVQRKLRHPISPDLLGLKSCCIRYDGGTIHVVSVPSAGTWSLRMSQPDTPFHNQRAVPGRTWTTEVALAPDGANFRLGVRVTCESLSDDRTSVLLTRPRVVLDLAQGFTLSDVRTINGKPWRLQNQNDLVAFQELLLHCRRSLPVHLLTQVDARPRARPFLLDEDYLARKLHGLAHVVTMPMMLGLEWAKHIGRNWSAFRGAVRTFRPGLVLKEDAPAAHPLVLAPSITAFKLNGRLAEKGFTESLIEQTYELAASKRVEWFPCLFCSEALERQAELECAVTNDPDEQQQVFEQILAVQTERPGKAGGPASRIVLRGTNASIESPQLSHRSKRCHSTSTEMNKTSKNKSTPTPINSPGAMNQGPTPRIGGAEAPMSPWGVFEPCTASAATGDDSPFPNLTRQSPIERPPPRTLEATHGASEQPTLQPPIANTTAAIQPDPWADKTKGPVDMRVGMYMAYRKALRSITCPSARELADLLGCSPASVAGSLTWKRWKRGELRAQEDDQEHRNPSSASGRAERERKGRDSSRHA